MNEDQREQWQRAIDAKNARQRRRQPAARGVRNVKGAGMVRVLAPGNIRPGTRGS